MSLLHCAFGIHDHSMCHGLNAFLSHFGNDAARWSPALHVHFSVFRGIGNDIVISNNGAVLLQGFISPAAVLPHNRTFGSPSDAQQYVVDEIANQLEIRGEEAFVGLNGNFILIAFSNTAQKLFAVCDPAGSVPLYVTRFKGGWLLASRIKSLLAIPDLPAAPDIRTIQQHQYSGWAPRGATFVQNIFAAEPGIAHVFTHVSHHRTRIARYRSVVVPQQIGDAAIETDVALERAISRCVPHHRHIGVALSGGVDSLYLLAKMRSIIGERSLKTFTFGYGDGDPQMERSAQAARLYGTEHHEVVVEPHELPSLLPRSIYYMEEPVGRDHFVCLYKMAEYAAGMVDALFFGNGIEDSFGGAEIHDLVHKAARYPALRGVMEDLATQEFSGKPALTAVGCMALIAKQLLEGCKTPPAAAVSGSLLGKDRVSLSYPTPALSNLMKLDLFRMNGHFRVKTAALCDVSGAAMRMPYFDTDVVNLGMSFPDEYRRREGQGKYIFRLAARRTLPEQYAWIPKGVSRLKHDSRMWEVVSLLADRYASDDVVRQRGIFDLSSVQALRRGRRSRRTTRWLYRLWHLVALEIWLRLFIDSRGSAAGLTAFSHGQQ